MVGSAIEAASAGLSGPVENTTWRRRVEIGGDHGERNRRAPRTPPAPSRAGTGAQNFSASTSVALPKPTLSRLAKLPARAWTRRRNTSVRLCASAIDVAADLPAGHAGRIGRADQRADRGAGDRDRPHAHLVERLEHHDMGEAARAAAAEREREASSFRARLPGELPGACPRAAAPSAPCRRRSRWSRCRRARGRRCPAGSRRGGRNCRRDRSADAAADRARCAHVGLDIVGARRNAERRQIVADQRADAGTGVRRRHVPLHQVIGEDRRADRRASTVPSRAPQECSARTGARIMLSSR